MNTAHLPRPLSVELHIKQPHMDVRAQLRVLPGRVCALVGREGSGQRALLEATAGLKPALSGRVSLGHAALFDSAARIDLPPHLRQVGWLDRHAHLFPHLSVAANLAYGPRAMGRRLREQRGMDLPSLTRWLDLAPISSRKPHELTPSQRVRVALARALAATPHALLMDDPLGEVPEHERADLLELLAQVPMRFKLPVVLHTPRMDEVIRMADEVVILHEGRMAGAGPVSQILSDVSLSTFLEGVHAGSVLEGEVTRHDIEWLLSEVDVGGQRVTVPATLHGVGSKVRLKVRARDISLHRHPPADTSSSNHLHGRISHIMLAGEHGTYGAVGVELARELDASLHLKAGAQVWTLLTRKSIQQMGWAPGEPCIIGFKAMATTVTPWR